LIVLLLFRVQSYGLFSSVAVWALYAQGSAGAWQDGEEPVLFVPSSLL